MINLFFDIVALFDSIRDLLSRRKKWKKKIADSQKYTVDSEKTVGSR